MLETNEYIDHFLQRNHEKLSITEIMDKLELSYETVKAKCKELGLKLLSGKERTKKYILENYESYSMAEIALSLKLGLNYVRTIYKELNIKEPTMLKDAANPLSKEEQELKSQCEEIYLFALDHGFIKPNQAKITRPPAEYTQSSSPFGLADELRKIKTK